MYKRQPWLTEATNEAEQKQRIATLFDLNTMNSQLAVSDVYKRQGLDMISFGPTLRSPHSPDERALIPTVPKFYDFLVATLEQTPEK